MRADVAQLVEHVLGKDGVSGSIPLIGSRVSENVVAVGCMSSQGQMETPKFRIDLSDYSVSIDEWRRAHNASKSELPDLNELQREVAAKFGISEEDYARSVLAGQYGMRRLRHRARRLGDEVEKILAEMHPECRITRVVADIARERWVVVLQTPKRQVGIAVAREVGDDLIDFSTVDALEELRAKVKSAVEIRG